MTFTNKGLALQALFLLHLVFFAQSAGAARISIDERYEQEPVFGGKIFIRESGQQNNETVLLVHGLGDAASSDWEQTINALNREFHVLAFDLPGFGQSDKGNHAYSPTTYARLIDHIVAKHIRRPFHLVGHSMGGAIALKYASTYNENIKTLTLVDVAGILHRLAYTKFLAPIGLDKIIGRPTAPHDRVSHVVGALLGKLERKLPLDLSVLLNNASLRETVLKGNPSTIAALGLVLEDFSHAPDKVQQPTLIIWGRNDQVAPLRTGYVLDAQLPNSRLHIIENAGHVPIKNNFDEYATPLVRHLAGINYSKSDQPSVTVSNAKPLTTCNRRHNLRYTGSFEKLELNRCKNIVIENANIRELSAYGSQVTIINSNIISEKTALTSTGSNLTITAGRIQGKTGISANRGRIDIAGTNIVGSQAAISTIRAAEFIFSLVGIDSPNSIDHKAHGVVAVHPRRPL